MRRGWSERSARAIRLPPRTPQMNPYSSFVFAFGFYMCVYTANGITAPKLRRLSSLPTGEECLPPGTIQVFQ